MLVRSRRSACSRSHTSNRACLNRVALKTPLTLLQWSTASSPSVIRFLFISRPSSGKLRQCWKQHREDSTGDARSSPLRSSAQHKYIYILQNVDSTAIYSSSLIALCRIYRDRRYAKAATYFGHDRSHSVHRRRRSRRRQGSRQDELRY